MPPSHNGKQILTLVTDAFGQSGGIAQYNRDLLLAIGDQNEDVHIHIVPRHVSSSIGTLPANIIQYRPRVGKFVYAAFVFVTALTRRPDILFCGHIFMAPLAALIASMTGAKLVTQMHGIDAWNACTHLQRKAVESSDLIFCVSRYTRARLLEWADITPERVCVLPNTVAEQFVPGDRDAARRKFGLGGETILLSVSRLDARESYKGHDRIIPLLPELRTNTRNLAYLIAGEGNDQPRLEALAQHHKVDDIVRFLGPVPSADLPDLYRAADLFVLPSSGEGFGIVFLEAMACGTPALGLAEGGAVDALCDGELGITSDAPDLVDAIASTLKAPPTVSIDLAHNVRRRYGTEAFKKRAQILIEQVMMDHNIPSGCR